MDSKSQQKIISRHGPLISSNSTDTVGTKGNFSVEDSGPPSPHSGTVNNFGFVAPGVWRSSFPYPENVDHLKTLNLKTVLTLVDTEHSPEFNEFISQNGINHVRILVPAHKNPSVVIPIETIIEIQRLLLNPSNHPMLMHCNKGKHRTGCMVATYRKLHNVTMPSIITEYRKYAGAKYRPLDERYIATFNAPCARMILAGGGSTTNALSSYHALSEAEAGAEAQATATTATTSTQPQLPTPPPSDKSVGGDEEGDQEGRFSGGGGGGRDVYGMGQCLAL